MDLYEIRKLMSEGKSIYDLPIRVTFYARVSTDKDEQFNSLQNQIGYYQDYISQNLNWTFVQGYVDEGISGTSVEKRESFLKMIDDAQKKKFDFIITKEITRFSRNTVDSIQYTQKLLSYNVGVLFQSDNINTLLPDAELRLTIMASIAQDEVRKISERVKFGFKRSINTGRVLGNDCIWGYKKNDCKLEIVEDEAVIVRKIFDLYANENLGIRAVAAELAKLNIRNRNNNTFAFTTIRNIISNPKYKGFYCGNRTSKIDYRHSKMKYLDESEWVMYKDNDTIPPIVSEEIWDKANKILKRRSAKSKEGFGSAGTNNRYLYSGKIVCEEHDCSFFRTLYKYKSGDKEAWNCRKYSAKGLDGCTSPVLYTYELNEVVNSIINETLQHKADYIHKLLEYYRKAFENNSFQIEINKNQKSIEIILKKKDKLLSLSINDRITDSEFEERNNALNLEMHSLQEENETLKEQSLSAQSVEDNIMNIKKFIESQELIDSPQRIQLFVENFIDKIIVSKTKDRTETQLKVIFKYDTLQNKEYIVQKQGRNKTSVCYPLHIYLGTNRSIKFNRRINHKDTKGYDFVYHINSFMTL